MIEYLSWDSDFFSRKIGKVEISNTFTDLSVDLNKGRAEGFDLLYAFSDVSIELADYMGFVSEAKLVDRKVVYEIGLSNKNFESKGLIGVELTEPSHELECLAYESGKYSRFFLDKRFSESDFHRLYFQWIKKSLSKELADKVFVVEDEGSFVGMVTLKLDKIAQIGLIAVDSNFQGKGYGKMLIQHCFYEAAMANCESLVVPTQFENRQACRFYEKCGFLVQSITHIYHFWI
jgi:dTDP-4-amino-4,6-dideoxy-D-galactose acyltransferase